MELEQFFATMRPFLSGQCTAESVQARLGPCASGSDALQFYRTLMRRNVHKAMRELYPSLPILSERWRAGSWRALVDDYVQAHPLQGRHPDAVGRTFPEFLQRRSELDPEQPVWLEECADYHACQLQAATAREDCESAERIDVTVFVRRYTHPIPALVRGAATGDATEREPIPTTLIIYRSWRDHRVRTLRPRPIDLLVLGRRQGLPSLPAVPLHVLEQAEHRLTHCGVIRPRALS